MKRVLFLAACLALLIAAPYAQAITKEDVVKLTQAGLGDEVIIAKIRKDGTVFDLSAADILELKKAGVTAKVLQAMLQAAPAPAPAPKEEPPAATPPAEEPVIKEEPKEEPKKKEEVEEPKIEGGEEPKTEVEEPKEKPKKEPPAEGETPKKPGKKKPPAEGGETAPASSEPAATESGALGIDFEFAAPPVKGFNAGGNEFALVAEHATSGKQAPRSATSARSPGSWSASCPSTWASGRGAGRWPWTSSTPARNTG